MKLIKIRNIFLGDGRPKICLPITAKNEEELNDQLAKIKAASHEMVEIRVDFFEGDPLREAALVRAALPDEALIFTFRTLKEGGVKDISREDYAKLNLLAAQSGLVDVIDVEYNLGVEFSRELCSKIQETGVLVISSFHDFEKTPWTERLLQILKSMEEEVEADIAKVAVMPRSMNDVQLFMNVAFCIDLKCPTIYMSMGRLGAITRLAGGVMNSAVTFAAAGAVSAPGQLDAILVEQVLNAL